MQTHTIVGKPKQTVTLEVDGQSLTFTEGVEVAVFVVVAAQQPRAADADYCICEVPNFNPVSDRCEFCRKLSRAANANRWADCSTESETIRCLY